MLKIFRFPQELDALRARHPEGLSADSEVARSVRAVIEAVGERGDASLAEFSERFDGVALTPAEFRVAPEELAAAWEAQSPAFREALQFARERIERFHSAQLPRDIEIADPDGTQFRRRYRALGRVGIYVPGGSAAYPSTLLMDAIPAQVAGVGQIAMFTPPARAAGPAAGATLAAAHLLGLTEVYRIGGAQAIAAMALGTATIPRVDKIVGPGNAYVNEAKRLLYGRIDIDSLAGPSDILVLADATTRADYAAADLLSQAEHSPDAQAVLIAIGGAAKSAEEVAAPILGEVARQTALAPRRAIIEQSLARFGTAILVENEDDAVRAADWRAAEHVEVLTSDPAPLAERISNAGAIFVGEHTPEAVCDYVAGPNHVLPTGGTARFFSGLSALSFLRATNITRMSPEGLRACAPHVQALAEVEGLPAHAASVAIRYTAAKEKR